MIIFQPFGNLMPKVKEVTINGAWISARLVTGEEISVRCPDDNEWYDTDHERVMEKLTDFERVLAVLINKSVKPK